jgi:hypothetical protein
MRFRDAHPLGDSCQLLWGKPLAGSESEVLDDASYHWASCGENCMERSGTAGTEAG